MFEAMNLTAADVMPRDVVTVHPNDSLKRAARIMLERDVSGLPVVDNQGHVVGVVSEGDLIRPDEMAERRARWWLDVLAEGEQLSPEFLAAIQAVNRPVSKVMRTDVVSIGEHAPLREVAELIMRQNIRRVLVMDGPKLVGVVARRDLVKVLAHGK